MRQAKKEQTRAAQKIAMRTHGFRLKRAPSNIAAAITVRQYANDTSIKYPLLVLGLRVKFIAKCIKIPKNIESLADMSCLDEVLHRC